VSFDPKRAVEEHGPDLVREALLPFVSESRQARIDRVLDRRLSSVTVVLENLYDAHNGAAAIRSIEAFGLCEAHAVENVGHFKFAPKVTVGCDRWVDIHRYDQIEDCARALKDRGFILSATLPDAETELEDLDGTVARALVFGNEHEGLTEGALALCDEFIRIPMHGFTQSFNLSVSVALLVQRAAAVRRAAIGAIGDLEEEKKRHFRALWYAHSVRGAAGILDRYVAGQTQ